MSEPVTRQEFRMLAERIESNERRLDTIDTSGTRGVGVLAVQIQELAKDIAAHEQRHAEERRMRAAGRRWMFMAAVALVAAVDGPVVTVLLAVHGH